MGSNLRILPDKSLSVDPVALFESSQLSLSVPWHSCGIVVCMARPDPAEPGLPLKLEPCSNGEYLPSPASKIVRRTIAETNRVADVRSRRLGLSRRQFLQSSAGMATMMAVLAACSSDEGQTGGEFNTTTSSSSTTTTSSSPASASSSTATEAIDETEETMDEDAATEALAAPEGEFIFDIQGHLLEYPDDAPGNPGFPQSNCGEAVPGDCYGIDHFFEAIFVDSETTMVMLSAIPFGNGALSNTVMQRAVDTAGRFGCSERVLMQGESFPTSRGIDVIEEVAANFNINAFKTYTHNGGPAWRLDDDTGNAYFEKVQEVGVPIVAVHKGLSGNAAAASPVDVGPAAVNHPDVDILVYHSGYENSITEGPYSPDADVGVNRLITSVLDSGSPSNVYAELGSTWRNVMASPNEAAHLLGKLLVHLGEDNILWGTDSLWYGNPQDQIQLFRAFQISEEFQEQFGYPALTDEMKAKIFGGNAARVFGVDLPELACGIDETDIQMLRAEREVSFDYPTTNRTYQELGWQTYQRDFGHRA